MSGGDTEPLTRSKLHTAASQGDVETLSRLLDDGHCVDVRDRHGNTPLHVCGHAYIVTCLIVHGCDLFARNKNNDLALDLMIRRGVNQQVLDYVKEEMENLRGHRELRRKLTGFWVIDLCRDIGVYRCVGMAVVCGLVSFYVAYSMTSAGQAVEVTVPLHANTNRVEL